MHVTARPLIYLLPRVENGPLLNQVFACMRRLAGRSIRNPMRSKWPLQRVGTILRQQHHPIARQLASHSWKSRRAHTVSLGASSSKKDAQTEVSDLAGSARESPDFTSELQPLLETPKSPLETQTVRYIPNSLLEHWGPDLINNVPGLSQRKFANAFFESSTPKLIFTAGSLHQVAFTEVPEVAFLGRSNVGKSTLLNALLGQKVAHVSAKPGRTRTLNAWAAGGLDRTGNKWRLTVLDMPGYGEGSRLEWGTTIQKYLAQRKELKRVFVLVNAVHGLKDSDRNILEMLRQASIPHQIVLSKADSWFSTKGKILPTKSDVNAERLKKILGDGEEASKIQEKIDHIVETIRAESRGDRRQRELPAVLDILACSGEGSKLPGQPPEKRQTLGITALRWAVLQSVGITQAKMVKTEINIAFDSN